MTRFGRQPVAGAQQGDHGVVSRNNNPDLGPPAVWLPVAANITGDICQLVALEGPADRPLDCSDRLRPWYPPGVRRTSPSSRGPLQGPAAEHVQVSVRHILPGVRAAIEDDAVAGSVDALGDRDTVRQAGHLFQQAAGRLGDRRDVGIMFFRYDQHMCGCLRIDITERDSP